jgi:phospholipid transport system substrate-binding protein
MTAIRVRGVIVIAVAVGLTLGSVATAWVGTPTEQRYEAIGALIEAVSHAAAWLGLALAVGLALTLWPERRAPRPGPIPDLRWRPEMRATQVRSAIVIAAVVGVALGSAGPASAGAPTEQLRTAVDRVLQIVEDSALKQAGRTEERRVAIRTVASEIFDFGEITRRALGPHWASGTPAQREQLVQLFTALLERSYVGKIEAYSGERMAWLGDTGDESLATVRTRIVTKAGTEIPVEYRMYRRGERWLAYDVTIEGISLVANYRAQFNKIIQASSHAGLVAQLRAKQP